MDEVILTEADGEGYAVPDLPEVEIPFDALNDTLVQEVTGVESLTDAQHYMEGLLVAHGVHRASSVTGNESFFSKVGSGARAVYDWIKKMIKSLWDFFFKRDAPKASEEAKSEIKAAVAAADGAAEGGTTPAQTEKILDKQVSELEKLKADPHANKAVLDQLWKEAHDARGTSVPHAEKKEVAKRVAKEIVKVNGGHAHLQNQVDKLVRTLEHVVQYAEQQASNTSLGEEYQKFVKSILGDSFTKPTRDNIAKIKSIKAVADPAEAKKVLGELLADMQHADKAVAEMRRLEASMNADVKKAEAALTKSNDPEAKKTLEELRKFVGFTARVAKYFETTFEQATAIARSYRHLFGG